MHAEPQTRGRVLVVDDEEPVAGSWSGEKPSELIPDC